MSRRVLLAERYVHHDSTPPAVGFGGPLTRFIQSDEVTPKAKLTYFTLEARSNFDIVISVQPFIGGDPIPGVSAFQFQVAAGTCFKEQIGIGTVDMSSGYGVRLIAEAVGSAPGSGIYSMEGKLLLEIED